MGVVIEDVTDQDNTVPATQEAPSVTEGAHDSTEGASPGEVLTPAEAGPAPLSDADAQKLEEAEACKQEGNRLYAAGNLEEAVEKYGEALQLAPEGAGKQRAVYYANLAACHLKGQRHEDAVADASEALRLEPGYVKALMRRSAAYEALDDLEHALADSIKVKELDPDNPLANKTVQRLTPIVDERREKMKDEMLGKLKDLGNTVLGKFGMSLDNFKMDKDPNTGSYSINFKQ